MNEITKILNKYWIIVLIIIYKTLLEISYINIIHPRYDYMGFSLDINWGKWVFSFLLVLFIGFQLRGFSKKPSDLVLFYLFIIMYIPFSSIYWLKDESSNFFVATSIGFVITLIITKVLINVRIPTKMKKNYFFYIVVSVFSFITISTTVIYNGVPRLDAINLGNVYEVRENFKYGINAMKYILTWQVWVINLFLAILFLIKKKYLLLFIPFGLQFIFFLYTGHKAYIFLMLIIPVVYVFLKINYIYIISLLGFIFLTLLSWISHSIFNVNDWVSALFTHRLLYLPAQISYQYYEYYSTNGLVYLSHSVFKTFIKKPIYDEHPIKIIGQVYYDNNWPNTGYLTDAYMNFGVIGILIFSIIFALLLVAFNSFASMSKVKRTIVNIMVILFVIYFYNGALLTSLMNGGILFFIFLLLIYVDNIEDKGEHHIGK